MYWKVVSFAINKTIFWCPSHAGNGAATGNMEVEEEEGESETSPVSIQNWEDSVHSHQQHDQL